MRGALLEGDHFTIKVYVFVTLLQLFNIPSLTKRPSNSHTYQEVFSAVT